LVETNESKSYNSSGDYSARTLDVSPPTGRFATACQRDPLTNNKEEVAMNITKGVFCRNGKFTWYVMFQGKVTHKGTEATRELALAKVNELFPFIPMT
jgi:hypothetical protein